MAQATRVIVADTGVLYALVDTSDEWHERVLSWWRAARSVIVVPVTVLPEVTFLLHHRISPLAERAFVDAVANGEFTLEDLEIGDVARASELMQEYGDQQIGFVDSSIVAIAERLEAKEIATTDRRHFAGMRPRHARFFTLLP